MRTLTSSLFLGGLALLALLPTARAQTGYPMVASVYPVGLQRGQATVITVTGAQNFAGAYGVLFESAGMAAEIVPPEKAPEAGKPVNSVTLRVTASPEAPLGPQEFRVATPQGLSSVGLLVVGTEAEALEKEGNNTPQEAQSVELPVTANGKIQAAEDVDCWKFAAKAGEEVAFRCVSSRLQDKIHDLTPGAGGAHSDPILVLTDETGRELATADDYYGPDPLLSHRFEKAGTYVVQIRDVRYLGSDGWTYRLTCTSKPFLTALYPMAGQRGQEVDVQPVGMNLGGMAAAKVKVPMTAPGPVDVHVPAGGEMTNPVPFLVSDLPQAAETGQNNTHDSAQAVDLPAGINGRIEAENDADCYRFKGAKGQVYTFEVFARRHDSRLDPAIQILDTQGRQQVYNDDALGKDSRLDWTCPADGEFILHITDLHSGGGPDFVYHVAAGPARPDFALRSDDDKALLGPGSSYAMYVIADRRNGFTGDVRLSVEGLPPGVTATADRIPQGMTQGCVVLTAAPGTKPSFSRIRMWGAGEVTLPDGKKETLRREVTPMQEIYTPGGGRATYAVKTHVAGVTGPSDVLLKLSASQLSLKPGETASVDVEVVRQNGYDKNVILDVYLRHLGQKYGDPLPKGVVLDEAASKTLLAPGETKGKIVLKAAGDAPEVENLPIAVLGQVSINFVVKVSHASEPLRLTVKK